MPTVVPVLPGDVRRVGEDGHGFSCGSGVSERAACGRHGARRVGPGTEAGREATASDSDDRVAEERAVVTGPVRTFDTAPSARGSGPLRGAWVSMVEDMSSRVRGAADRPTIARLISWSAWSTSWTVGSAAAAARAARPPGRPRPPGRRGAVGVEDRVEGDVALDQAERDRAQLVVPGRRADEAHRSAVEHQVGAALGQPVRRSRRGAAASAGAAGRPSVCTRATVSWPR